MTARPCAEAWGKARVLLADWEKLASPVYAKRARLMASMDKPLAKGNCIRKETWGHISREWTSLPMPLLYAGARVERRPNRIMLTEVHLRVGRTARLSWKGHNKKYTP